MNITFIAKKSNTGMWVFDHDHKNTINEPLCNGTELVLDEYFKIDIKREPKEGDLMHILASTEDFEESDTVLELQSTTVDNGSVYLDMVLFEKVWLCPWLQSYFGHVPSELYVQLIPVNPGLSNFNKNYANPFLKYLKKNGDESDKLLKEFTNEDLIQIVNNGYFNNGRI